MLRILVSVLHGCIRNGMDTRSVVVAQWVKKLLPTPVIRGSNPAISKFYLLSYLLNLEKAADKGPF